MTSNLAIWMFPALFALIFMGIPVSFSLIVVAVLFAIPFFGDLAGLQLFRFIGSVASNYALAAVPLFIFMGAILEGSGMARRLFNAMRSWMGWLPGGVGVSAIAMCAVFAAGTGIVGAVEVMVGLLAIPAMLRDGYSRPLISGTICAGGSLGTIIPPSLVVIIYASVGQLSVGDLFAGILIPGLMMVVLFLGYIMIASRWSVDPSRIVIDEEAQILAAAPLGRKLALTAHAMLPPLLLMTAVIGSIMMGIAAVTEAAAVGAAGAVVLKLFYREFSWTGLYTAARTTVRLTSMIMLIVVGGTLFTSVFRINGGATMIRELVLALDLSQMMLILALLAVVFVMGALLDWVSVVLICVPIFLPVLPLTGADPLWFAVLVIVVIQTSYLTPPMAPSIFYLRGIAPPDFSYRDMYIGVLPFVACQLLVLVALLMFPPLATYLPELFRP